MKIPQTAYSRNLKKSFFNRAFFLVFLGLWITQSLSAQISHPSSTLTLPEDSPAVDVFLPIVDPSGSISFSSWTTISPLKGSLTPHPDNNDSHFQYTPFANEYGNDFFDWNATDANTLDLYPSFISPGSSYRFQITITPDDDVPNIFTGTGVAKTDSNFTSGTTALYTLPENQTLVTTITIDDPDSSSFVMATTGADGSKFNIQPGPDAFTFYLHCNSPLDFENPPVGSNGTFNFNITASDASNTDSQTIQVVLGNVEEAPYFAGGGSSMTKSMSEDGVPSPWPGLILEARDPELQVGEKILWAISSPASNGNANLQGGSPQGLFNTISYTPNPNYFNTPTTLDSFVVTITDPDSLSRSMTINVEVVPVNDDSPTFDDSNYSLVINENTTTVIDVTASDPDQGLLGIGFSADTAYADWIYFNLDPVSGQIGFKVPPDFENDPKNGGLYSIGVKIEDLSYSPGQYVSQVVTVRVEDVNEVPVYDALLSSPFSVTINEDSNWSGLNDMTPALSIDDQDLNHDGNLSWSVVVFPSRGTLVCNGTGSLPANFWYMPEGNSTSAESFTIRATDLGGLTADLSFGVSITPVSDSPYVTSFDGNTSVIVYANENAPDPIFITANEVDGDTLNYVIHGGQDKDRFFINSSTGQLEWNATHSKGLPDYENTNDFDFDGNYSVTIRIEDGTAAPQKFQTLHVRIIDINEVPSFVDVPNSINVPENSLYVLDANVSDIDDAENNLPDSAFTWEVVNDPSTEDDDKFTIDENGTLRFKTIKDYEVPVDQDINNSYEISLRVRDPRGAPATKNISVVVTDVNDPPVVTSGINASVNENETFIMDLTAHDDDNDTLRWYLVDGNMSYFFVNENNGSLYFKNPADADAGVTVYDLTVEVRDTSLTDGNKSMQIQVIGIDEAPVFTPNVQTLTLNEDGSVDFNASSIVFNPEVFETITFTHSIPQYGTLINNTAQSTFSNLTGAFTYTPNADFHGVDSFEINATDSTNLIGTLRIDLTVNPVNDPPLISNKANFAVPLDRFENNASVYDFDVTDLADDPSGNDTYNWILLGKDFNNSHTDHGHFQIDANGVVTFANSPDYDNDLSVGQNNTYEFVVMVKDSGDANDTLAVRVRVNDANEPPTFSLGKLVYEMNEDGSFPDANYTGLDNNLSQFIFDPDSSSVLNWMISPRSDTNGTPSLTALGGILSYVPTEHYYGVDYFDVNVTDGEFNATIAVEVTVHPINDAPTILQPITVGPSMNHPEKTIKVIDFNGTDANDLGNATPPSNLSWSLGGTDQNKFKLNSQGVLSFVVTPTFTNEDDQYDVIITVTDLQGASTSYPLSIFVIDAPDPPAFDNAGPFSITLEEDATALDWSNIWTDVNATDPEGDPVYWYATNSNGNDQNGTYKTPKGTVTVAFRGGQVSYVPDPDVIGADVFYVMATDLDLNSTYQVSVFINSVNDSPVISDANTSSGTPNPIQIVENNMYVRDFVAADEKDSNDSTIFQWGVAGADSSHFKIESNGSLYFSVSPDYDLPSPVSSGVNKRLFDFNVTITDDSSLFTHYPIRVLVTNVNEYPVFSTVALERKEHNSTDYYLDINVSENTTYVYDANVTDQENDSITFDLNASWKGHSSIFSIHPTTGLITLNSGVDWENPALQPLYGGITPASGGVYNIQVLANDNGSPPLTKKQNLLINIVDENDPPIFQPGVPSSPSVSYSLDENATHMLNFASRVVDYGPNPGGQNLVYSVSGVDGNATVMNAATGILTFANGFGDYENPLDQGADQVYDVNVTVSDGEYTLSQEWSFSLNDTNDLPTFDTSGTLTYVIPENQLKVGNIRASDEDGNASLLDVVYIVENGSVNWVENTGDSVSRFQASQNIDISLTTSNVSMVGTADFDRNGKMDVFALREGSNIINFYYNTGGGNFGAALEVSTVPEGSGPDHAVVADVNEDGYPDLVVALSDDGNVSWYENDRAGGFNFGGAVDTNVSGVTFVDAGDIDNDGDLDVVAVSPTDHRITWFDNNSSGGFSFSGDNTLVKSISIVHSPRTAVLGDADYDGDLDVLVTSINDGNFSLFINDGTGNFGAATRLYQHTGGQARIAEFAYIDSDDKLDIVLVATNPNKIGVMLQNANAPGTFSSPDFFYTGGLQVTSLKVGDLNNNGFMDIAAASPTNDSLMWFINNGSGGFTLSGNNVVGGVYGINSISLAHLDNEKDNLRFSVIGGNDVTRFSFRPLFSGNLFFNQPPDYENPVDKDKINQYEILVEVDDNVTGKSQKAISITVTNTNEPPVFTGGGNIDLNVSEHMTGVVYDSNTTNDESLVQTTTFSFGGGLDDNEFDLNQTTGILTFKSPPDFENPFDSNEDNIYSVIIKATDTGNPPASSEQALTINVINGNDKPFFIVATGKDTIVVQEDTNSSIPFNITDRNATDNNMTGKLQLSVVVPPSIGSAGFIGSNPNYLVGPNLWYSPDNNKTGVDQLTVRVTDDQGLYADKIFYIDINNSNDAPIITYPTAVFHPENNAQVALLTANDGDGDSLTWFWADENSSAFQYLYLEDNGNLRFRQNALPDFENPGTPNNLYILDLNVTDGKGGSDSFTLTINITGTNDSVPFVSGLNSSGTTIFKHPEGLMQIVDFNASDADDNTSVSLDIVGGEDDNGSFILDANGKLRFTPIAPDFENPFDIGLNNTYKLTIRVTDGNPGNLVDYPIVIDVFNVDESPPTITSYNGQQTVAIPVNENTSYVGRVEATDDLVLDLNFSIVFSNSDDNALFTIDQNGTLAFKSPPNFESKLDTGTDNFYDVQVAVSDGTNPFQYQAFSIEVKDQNEAPDVFASVDGGPVQDLRLIDLYVDAGTSLNLILSVSDPDVGDVGNFSVTQKPQNGTWTDSGGGSYVYTPTEGYIGQDSVTLLVTDNGSYSESFPVTIYVQKKYPIAVKDAFTYDNSGSAVLLLNVMSNDVADPKGAGSTFLTISQWAKTKINGTLSPELGTVLQYGDSFTYQPSSSFIGPQSFSYTLTDGDRNATGQVDITVTRASGLPNWRFLQKFGYYKENSNNWIYHTELGWLYLAEKTQVESSTWMWHQDMGWFWSGDLYFPNIYINDLSRWLSWNGTRTDGENWTLYDHQNSSWLTPSKFQEARIALVFSSLSNVESVLSFVQSSSIFSDEQKETILSEFALTGQSATLSSMGYKISF